MSNLIKCVFLADDETDDRALFEDALREISIETSLTTTKNGEELMTILDTTIPPPPHIIFLDLNMPRKNGFECLAEIRAADKLKNIPVVFFSTSSDNASVDKVYEQGADYYIHKPDSFPKLIDAISKILAINWEIHTTQPSREEFLLTF